jgi:hypothetical protein
VGCRRGPTGPYRSGRHPSPGRHRGDFHRCQHVVCIKTGEKQLPGLSRRFHVQVNSPFHDQISPVGQEYLERGPEDTRLLVCPQSLPHSFGWDRRRSACSAQASSLCSRRISKMGWGTGMEERVPYSGSTGFKPVSLVFHEVLYKAVPF